METIKHYWGVQNFEFDLRLGTHRYSSFHSFIAAVRIRNFNTKQWKYNRCYDVKELQFNFVDVGKCKIKWKLFGGKYQCEKHYEVIMNCPYSVFDMYESLSGYANIIGMRPRVLIERLDVSFIFLSVKRMATKLRDKPFLMLHDRKEKWNADNRAEYSALIASVGRWKDTPGGKKATERERRKNFGKGA